ncbi:MAG: LPS export ABC transporter ATP-binding protein [Myxococcales bacterium]|nr:LPS export ABC transporter ATP-binding protein [Myxococcales bacterium]
MSLLLAKGLVRRFGNRRVVDGVDLTLEPGQTVGLLGPNGAGKTTTFRLIAGLLRPEQGRIEFDGKDVSDWPLHRRARAGLGYLAQECSLFPGMSVRENLLTAAALGGIRKDEARERADALLERLDLGRVEHAQDHTLSGGERRRAEIGRALMVNPKVLLFDEPFAGVDPVAVASLQEEIQKLASTGLAVLITDHAVAATFAICDQVSILNEGRVLVSGAPETVSSDPLVRAAYLGPE